MKRKRALESMEDTLRRQEKNKTRIASMRGSETKEQILERLEQNRTHMASMRASETAHENLHKKGKNQGSYGQRTYKNCACRRCHCCIPSRIQTGTLHFSAKNSFHNYKFSVHCIIIHYKLFRIAHHQCKMCWNKALTFGVGLIKKSRFSCYCVHATHACKDVFNPNVTIII